VVGGGFGGLAAAALLARAGKSVLLVERHDRVGGYGHAFRRGRYLFDSAIHVVGGCEPVAYEGGGLIHRLLSALGVRDQLHFERIDPCYEAVYPGLSLRVPCDLDGFVDAHAEEFPAEEKGLRELVQECLNVRQETLRAAESPASFDLGRLHARFPTLLRYRRATLARVLEEHIESPRLRALLGTLWPFLGLPPSQLSFVYFATMLMSYVADGAYYCRGSFQRLADVLAGSVRANGGEVVLRSPVRRIAVERRRACGIVLENGQRIGASRVISNADLLQTVHELVGAQAFPEPYLAGLARLRPSLSAFVAYVATDLPLERGTTSHETFYYPSWDHDAAHASSLRGLPAWISVTAPTLADPTLAPEGEHLLLLTALVRHGALRWREHKAAMTNTLVAIADRWVGGLAGRVRFQEGATPRTLERYTRNSGGALYGWELSPRHIGPGRPATSTPLAGLHLVGHWTQPGGGVTGVMTSGVQVACEILGREPGLWAAPGG